VPRFDSVESSDYGWLEKDTMKRERADNRFADE